MDSPVSRLAEITTIILCTCFPMMPRLVKLISDRRAKSRSYSTSPLGHAWKRKKANDSTDESSSGAGSAGSHTAEQTIRLKRPYEQLEDEESNSSDSRIEIRRTEDIELAMFDVQEYGDILEQRLNVGFTIPRLSYP